MADHMQATISELASSSEIDLTQLDRTFLRPNPDVQGTTMDGETVLLDLSSGRYYTLNHLGSIIWEQCKKRQAISAIHAALCERFEVNAAQALDDLVALINTLIQEGLLQQERR
jgi:Coenzyme PQQ synthesis protein D (PqqD)